MSAWQFASCIALDQLVSLESEKAAVDEVAEVQPLCHLIDPHYLCGQTVAWDSELKHQVAKSK